MLLDADLLPRFHFNSTLQGRAESYALWRQARNTLFGPHDTDTDSVDSFEIDFTVYNAGAILIGGGHVSPQRFYRTRDSIRRDGLDHYLLILCKTSYFEGNCDGKHIHMAPGEIGLFSLTRPADTRATAGDFIGLTLPHSLLSPLLKNPDDVSGTVLDKNNPMRDILYTHCVEMLDQMETLKVEESAIIAATCAAMIAVCFGQSTNQTIVKSTRLRSANLAAMRRFIDTHLAVAELDAEMLLQTFPVSRATLYRLFAPLGGIAVFIRKKRLARAFLDLQDRNFKGLKINDIAARNGFSSAVSFSRAFHAEYGAKPSEVRREPAVAKDIMQKTKNTTTMPFSDWLYELAT
jgi:AraC-like DNA-binding protein